MVATGYTNSIVRIKGIHGVLRVYLFDFERNVSVICCSLNNYKFHVTDNIEVNISSHLIKFWFYLILCSRYYGVTVFASKRFVIVMTLLYKT